MSDYNNGLSIVVRTRKGAPDHSMMNVDSNSPCNLFSLKFVHSVAVNLAPPGQPLCLLIPSCNRNSAPSSIANDEAGSGTATSSQDPVMRMPNCVATKHRKIAPYRGH